jgi:hypothetical protein
VVRDNNMGVDVLSKLGPDRANVPPQVFVHELRHPSIKAPDQSTIAPDSCEPDLWQNQPELYWLKYVSPVLRAPTCFKRYNPLACQVTSR